MKAILGKKGAAVTILFVLLGATAIPLASTVVYGNHEQGGDLRQLSYSFSFATPNAALIKTDDGIFTKISMPDCFALDGQPGTPIVPIKFIQLLLPPLTNIDAVTVTGSPVELRLPGIDLTKNRVCPSLSGIPVDDATPTECVMDESVYSSHCFFPEVPYGEYHVGYSRGYTLFSMALQPVQVIPGDGRLFYCPEMTITISLQRNNYVNPFFRGTSEDESWVKSLVCNPEVVADYAGLPKSGYPGGLCDSSQQYDYVIVTTSANGLSHWETGGSLTYNWTSLINHHTAEGLRCTEVLVQDINACPDYWNDSYYPLFNDTQAHIREFCKDAYLDWGTRYVLFAGDADVNALPPRLMDSEVEYGVDADLYWSNLDNSFNADHDNQWGEEGDNGFDVYSELFIGRIPCEVPQDVSNWMTKSFSYADATDPDYLENCGFYAGSMGVPPGYDGGDTLIDFAAINGTDHWSGTNPGQWPGFLGFLYGFETWNAVNQDNEFNLSVRWTSGSPPNPGWYNGDAVSGFRNAINNDSVTLITGIGHADNQMSLDVYASDWESRYHNTKPFFICDIGSHCGDFDAGNGILDSMLFHSDTTLAFGCLYNTGYSWAQTDSTNSSDALQTKLFWDYFLDLANNSHEVGNWQLGKGLAWSKDVLAPTLNWNYMWREMLQSRLLFADPAQLLRTPREANNPPQITKISWSSDFGLTVSAADPEGDNVFYMIDWGDGTVLQWFGPYPSGMEAVFMHIWSVPGDHWVRAKAKDTHNMSSDWTDSILVRIPDAELTITIKGGYGVTVTLNNTGNENLTNIRCDMGFSGFILLGKSTSDFIDNLPIGTSMIERPFFIGFGRTTVSANVTCAGGITAEKTAKGFVFAVFVFGLKE